MKKLSLILVVSFLGFTSFGQTITTSVSPKYDALVNSAEPNGNFGTINDLIARYDPSTDEIQRYYLQFDFSSIPNNAIITSAELIMQSSSIIGSTNLDLSIERVDSTWHEDSITWINQPGTYFSDQIIIGNSITSRSGTQSFDVTSHAQYFLNYERLNNGWSISLRDESSSPERSITYFSKEYSDGAREPKLEIEYILPLSLSTAVQHCSLGQSDGQLHVDLSGGSSILSSSIKIHKVVRDNNQLGKASLINVTSSSNVIYDGDLRTIDASNLEPGIYRLRVDDALYSLNSDRKYRFYKYFLVAREGETTSGILLPSVNYQEGVRIATDKPTASNPSGLSDINQSSYTNLYVTDLENNYEYASLIQYFMDFDDQLEFTKADLTIKAANAFYRGTNSTNATNYSLVTSPWDEHIVTWNTRPTVDPILVIDIPTTEVIGYDTLDLFDSLSILPFVEYWQDNPSKNYGFEIALESYNQTQYASRNYKGSSSNKNFIEFEFRLNPSISSTYNETTNTGEISVNAPKGNPLPYTYLLSYNSLPEMNDIWQVVKDSIDQDSVTFFRGDVNSESFTFTDLDPERYFVGVYDNDGVKIAEYETILSSDLEIFTGENLTIENGDLSVTSGAPFAAGVLDGLVEKNDAGAFEFEIKEMGDFTIGFINAESNPAGLISDFDFAFDFVAAIAGFEVYSEGNVVFTGEAGVGDKFRIEKENFDIIFYFNDFELFKVENSTRAVKDLRTDIVYKGSLGIIGAFVQSGKLIKYNFRPARITVYNTDCDGGNGSIRIRPTGGPFFPNTGITYQVVDLTTGNILYTDVLTTSYVTLPLAVGNYQVNFTSNNYSWSQQLTIGNAIDWSILNNYFSPLNWGVNTISTNSGSNTGLAISQNTLSNGQLGWVEFKHKLKKQFVPWGGGPQVLFSPSSISVAMRDLNNSDAVKVIVSSFGFNIINRSISVLDANGFFAGNVATYNDGPIRIELENNGTNNEFNITQNSGITQIASVIENTPADYKVYGTGFKGAIYDAYTSFCLGTTNTGICGHLKYELDGTYYVSNNGKFCFAYKEEYNDPSIELNIYNNKGELVADESNFVFNNPLIHGENRVVLDFSSSGYCLGTGFYVLEVINDKNERFYLRLCNGYNGCAGFPQSDDSNF